MPLEGNDELLVNRSGTTYTLEQQNLMAEIQDDDLLLVNRSGTTYTATGQELIDSVVPDLEIFITFVPNIPYIDEVITVVPNTSGGVEPEGGYTFTYQWSTSDDIDGNLNPTNILGANSNTYTPTEDQAGKFLGCTVQTTDDRGTIANATGRTGPIDFKPATDPPVINSVVLTQDAVNDKRFANNSFTTTVDASNRPSQLAMEAQVVGALSLAMGTDVIANEDSDGITPIDLILASEVNLGDGRFEVGDEVKANESYTPETDNISSVYEIPQDINVTVNAGFQLRCRGGGCAFTSSTFNQDGGFESPGGEITAVFDPPLSGNIKVWSIRPEDSYTIKLFNSSDVQLVQLSSSESPGTYGECCSYSAGNRSDVAKITINNNTNNDTVLSGITIDDVVLVNDAATGLVNITLSSSKDINKLEVGDKVQRELAIEYDDSQIWSNNMTGATSNSKLFEFGSANQADAATPIVINFVPALTGSISFYAYRPNDSTRKISFSINDSDQRDNINQDFGGGIRTWNGGATYNGINKLAFAISGSPPTTIGISQLKIADKWLMDPGTVIPDQYYNYIQIEEVDPNTLTIKTIGGNWASPDQSQTWSNDASFGNNNGPIQQPLTASFNGDISNAAQQSHSGAGDSTAGKVYWNPSGGFNFTDRVEVYVPDTLRNLYYSLNQGAEGKLPGTSGWFTIATGGGTVTQIYTSRGTTNSAVFFAAIRIDGKLLVDAFDDSQVWSNDSDWTTSNIESGSVANIFNGNTTEGLALVGVGSAEWTIPSSYGIKGNLLVRAFSSLSSSSRPQFFYNGVWNYPAEDPSSSGAYDFTFDTGANVVTGFKLVAESGNSPAVYNIYQNGKLLIDTGVRDLGDTKVKTEVAKQGQGTISAINSNVVTLDPITDNCFVAGQYLIHTSPKPIKITPKTEAIDTVSSDGLTLTLVGNDELIEFANGDPVSMCNADGTPAAFEAETSTITSKDISDGPQVIAGSQAGDVFSADKVYPPNDGTSYCESNEVRYFFDEPLSGSIEIGIRGDRNTFQTEVRVSTDGGTTSTVAFTGIPRNNAVPGTFYDGGDNSCSIALGTWTDINWIQTKRMDSGDSTTPMGVAVDKVRVTVANNGGKTTLTFTDNTNLEYFKAGAPLVNGPETGFNSQLYTGTGGSQSIKTGFSPDLIWIKTRSRSNAHILFDSLRGAGNYIQSNGSGMQEYVDDSLTSFDADGFTTGNFSQTNQSGDIFNCFCWDAGTAPASDTNSGGVTMSTQVKANVDKGFSVCRYNGGGGNNSYSHGLGQPPNFILVKNLDNSADWATYHSGVPLGHTGVLSLNTTGAWEAVTNQWNEGLPPTDKAVYLANNATQTNQAGVQYVAYNWVSTPGTSKFDAYTSTGTPFDVDCGFKPGLVMIKKYSSAGGNWILIYPEGNYVYANLTNGVGDASTQRVEFTETGFSVIGTNTDINQSGQQYIYAAWSAQEIFGYVLEDADTTANTMLVDGGDWDASNQSETWSNGTINEVSGVAGLIQNAFDGNLANSYFSGTSHTQDATFTFATPIPFTTLKLYYQMNRGGSGDEWQRECELDLNGVVVQNTNSEGSADAGANGRPVAYKDFTSQVTSPLTSIGYKFGQNGSTVRVYGIEVDGQLLVDPANESSVWSTGLSLPDGLASGTYAMQFDGNLSTYANPATASNVWSFLCPETIVLTENIKLKPPFVENFNYTWSIGGNSGQSATITDTGWYELQGTSGKSLSPSVPLVIGSSNTSVAPKFTGMMVNGELLIDTGARYLGESTALTVSAGSGVVGSVNVENSTMTLSATNNQWVPGYYVSTPEKNAVEMRGYLSFDSEGNNVDLERLPQPPVLMDDLKTPKLNFPASFSTGEGVDTDLPFPTYLETYVVASNNLGSSNRVKSNELFPNWTGRPYIAPGSYRVMQDEFADWCYWACSSDYRAAIKTIQDAEDTVQELRFKAANLASDFLARDDVY